MFRKFLLYGLPLYLYILELFLKELASISSNSLAGPTLAGAGIGFLFPLTALKQVQIDPTLDASLKKAKAKAYSVRDKNFTDFVWVAFFAALAGWMYSLFLTMRPPSITSPNWSLVTGGAIFAASIILTEIKERI